MNEFLAGSAPPLQVRQLGRIDYATAFTAMQALTEARDATTPDELWLLEHPPIFTLGLNGRPEHLLAPGAIPVIRVDRGGQVTYHGPGQLVAYVLLDLRRAQLGVRQLVTLLEQSVIELLAHYGIAAHAKPEAPGVYVGAAKIASLGLRVRRGCSYHGLSLNRAMDLEPFSRINPCGYPGLRVTQLYDLGIFAGLEEVQASLMRILIRRLGYTTVTTATALPSLSLQEPGHA
ncbi:MAG: lipoyl(octanoyl) transferase LipB [Candidatus Competibacteraceae bacterium]